LPLNKAAILHPASESAIQRNKAVTVLTYLHGVKECQIAREQIVAQDPEADIELIELRSLKPLDMETIRASLQRTHKAIILDESTMTGGVGASISAAVHEQCYAALDAPVARLSMDDAPVPYASSMEQSVVKRAIDVQQAFFKLIQGQF
jgi:pyruvate/2-oxoglutarate/acetoin dehydrogenase E1 component